MSFQEHSAAADAPVEPGAAADPAPAPAPDEPDATAGTAATAGPAAPAREGGTPPARRNMLPARGRRRLGAERVLVRLVATCGIIGIGVVIAAVMVSSKSQGWVTGLVVSIVSVVLSAILWSSRQV